MTNASKTKVCKVDCYEKKKLTNKQTKKTGLPEHGEDDVRSRGQKETRVSQTNNANVAMLVAKLQKHSNSY